MFSPALDGGAAVPGVRGRAGAGHRRHPRHRVGRGEVRVRAEGLREGRLGTDHVRDGVRRDAEAGPPAAQPVQLDLAGEREAHSREVEADPYVASGYGRGGDVVVEGGTAETACPPAAAGSGPSASGARSGQGS